MQEEKISQLEKQTSVHAEKINSIEVSLENVRPLVEELKIVAKGLNDQTIALVKFTASHDETVRALERVTKRQDKMESQTQANTNEIAAARPAIKTMNELSKKMMYFGFFMVALSIAIVAYMVKG